ncbi:MAG: betaine--homocysteine S-methyltransferase [Pseudomonadota bacterium]
MPTALEDLLSSRDWILADGATGTNLFNMGLSSGDAPELWNSDAPEKIRALYQGSVDAGSDVFLTNTFGANASRLKLHGAEKRAHELSRIACEIARDVADSCDRPVVVAGSVGPTGEIMEPMGRLTYDDAVEMFHEQADGLKAGGADLAWVETISSPDEFRAAADAFDRADIPWCGTMSFDTAGRTMMGVTTVDMAELVQTLPCPPLAFGANCGVGASDLLRTVLGLHKAAPNAPLIAKGNAGIPKYVNGHIHYDGTPALMAHYATLALDAGATIIGGCCGTTPDHLRAMRAALETHEKGQPPSLDTIVKGLGAFSSQSDGTDGHQKVARQTRRRRRTAA